jgi:hypothetical protein
MGSGLSTALIACVSLSSSTMQAGPAHAVTFHRDVQPILQQRCQVCHRAGEAAPFSTAAYEEVRPWAKAIREAVLTRKMPPWFADAAPGTFSNDNRLSQQEIDTLTAWVDQGAPAGDPKDAPKPAAFTQGWRIGNPDLIVEMPQEFHVPASGEIAWQYFPVPIKFTEDKWIQAVEARPGNPAVVHHVRIFSRALGSKAFMEPDPETSQERQHPKEPPKDDGSGVLAGPETGAEELTTFVPGGDPVELQPGQALLVRAGSDLVFEVHYTPTGKPQTDRSRVGLIFAKRPPQMRVTEVETTNLNFRIPAGAANHRVDTRVTLREDMTVLSLWPHMHLRGKALQLRAVYPKGESEVLLGVPHYDFNWQMSYVLAKPRLLPKGTRLESAVFFDNSANNPNNPDPKADVYWGDQLWEEMNVAFMRVALPAGIEPADIAVPPLQTASAPASQN